MTRVGRRRQWMPGVSPSKFSVSESSKVSVVNAKAEHIGLGHGSYVRHSLSSSCHSFSA